MPGPSSFNRTALDPQIPSIRINNPITRSLCGQLTNARHCIYDNPILQHHILTPHPCHRRGAGRIAKPTSKSQRVSKRQRRPSKQRGARLRKIHDATWSRRRSNPHTDHPTTRNTPEHDSVPPTPADRLTPPPTAPPTIQIDIHQTQTQTQQPHAEVHGLRDDIQELNRLLEGERGHRVCARRWDWVFGSCKVVGWVWKSGAVGWLVGG